MDEVREKQCVLCGAVLEGVGECASGEFRCGHCGTTGRYDAESLLAIFIPNYHRRLMELEAINTELVGEIEMEGMKGDMRDMLYLQKKHHERQDVLREHSLLSYFREYVERW